MVSERILATCQAHGSNSHTFLVTSMKTVRSSLHHLVSEEATYMNVDDLSRNGGFQFPPRDAQNFPRTSFLLFYEFFEIKK